MSRAFRALRGVGTAAFRTARPDPALSTSRGFPNQKTSRAFAASTRDPPTTNPPTPPPTPPPTRGLCDTHVPTFVVCGEGFAPRNAASLRADGPDWGGPSVRRAAFTDAASDDAPPCGCRKVIVLADAGHGVGRALLSSLLDFPDCKLVVAAASPSEDLCQVLRYQHWAECEALQLDVARVNLGDDDEVRAWQERVEFTHGVPDILVTNCGGMPSYWKTNYQPAAEEHIRRPDQSDACDLGEAAVVGGCRPGGVGGVGGVPARVWETRAADWSRMMNDVKGVSNVLRRFLPSMVARGEGAVVNVTHVLDPAEACRVAPYRSARAAVAELTRTLAGELAASRPRMTAVELDPGALPGLGSASETADVGPLHKTRGDESAADWAKAAVPFVLRLTPEVSGASLHVPGFGALSEGIESRAARG
jgi:NAD(P)-dependent dehydrogenase (short-subunit alcohol dehydrogenase family)